MLSEWPALGKPPRGQDCTLYASNAMASRCATSDTAHAGVNGRVFGAMDVGCVFIARAECLADEIPRDSSASEFFGQREPQLVKRYNYIRDLGRLDGG